MFFRPKNDKGKPDQPASNGQAPLAAPPAAQAAAMPGMGTAPVSAKPATVASTGRVSGTVANRGKLINKSVVVQRSQGSRSHDAALGMLTHLLMQSGDYEHLKLSDLKWLVVPALRTKQALIAVSKGKGQQGRGPLGAVLWASVSPEVDRRLTNELEQGIRLKPEEWKSGNIVWIVAVVGGQKVWDQMMRSLMAGQLKGKPLKMVGRKPDGKPQVVVVDPNRPTTV